MTSISQQNDVILTLADDFLHDYFSFYPTAASMLGLHEYDGRICDMRAESIAAFVHKLQAHQARLHEIDVTHLGRLAAFDYALLRWQIESELWLWTQYREYTFNPLVYTYNAMVDIYVQRDYAPLPERVDALTRHLDQIPEAMQTARQNLRPNIARILIEETQTVLSGLVLFLRQSLPEAVSDLRDPSRKTRLWAARDRAVIALADFQHYLEHTLLPVAHDDFAIGEKLFRGMLRYNELIDLPLDQLLTIGQADLERNKSALADLVARVAPDKTVQEQMITMARNHPSADCLVAETRALLDSLREFLRERDLVTLPEDEHCHVEETPQFARWAFAMMDTAGPFEKTATESFYYVTPPESNWSPDEVEGWMTKFDYATLTDVSMHEAYPGHFVHFNTVRHAPTRMAKVFACYSHYESWAHYVEQMMLEQGYGNDDPHLRMAQLAEALVRNCRYICAILMHTRGMSIQEATRFFMKHAYMDEMTASKEARRGTRDPGYINYTLGKLLLLNFLEQYRTAYGERFSLKRFHDEYISYGSPPISILRTMMLPPGYEPGPLL